MDPANASFHPGNVICGAKPARQEVTSIAHSEANLPQYRRWDIRIFATERPQTYLISKLAQSNLSPPLKESIKKAEILNFMFTGQVPSEYQDDPGKLVGAVWGIFSEKIAPDVACNIAAGMPSRSSGGGTTLQFDAMLLISPSGGKAADLTVALASLQR